MKRALVLGGGGARGAYQCGVWKYLKEKRMSFDLVVGTSCGALNGGLFVQGKYKECLQLWEDINVDKILNNGVDLELDFDYLMSQKERFLPMLQSAVKKKGMDNAPLYELIKKLADPKVIKKSRMDLFVVTVELPNLIPFQINIKEVDDELMADNLMASASCFPAFPVMNINGRKFVDGGYYDNLPINTALEQNADEILAVNLKGPGIARKPRPNNSVITVIEPYWSLGSMLSFKSEQARRNIALGYQDARKTLGDWKGYAYAFKNKKRTLEILTDRLERRMAAINNAANNKLLANMRFLLNSTDEKLLQRNGNKAENSDITLRLIEKVMELLDYSPTAVYDCRKVTAELTTEIDKVEKVNIGNWFKKFVKNPKITIKEFEMKNLIFTLATELDNTDPNIILLFYSVFPSECLMGLLIKELEEYRK